MTVYSVEWISPRPAQMSRPESKQSIGCIMFFMLCPMDTSVWPMDNMGSISLQQDSISMYFSLTGQYKQSWMYEVLCVL